MCLLTPILYYNFPGYLLSLQYESLQSSAFANLILTFCLSAVALIGILHVCGHQDPAT